MFKKPVSNLKTSAPLRSSDRRKMKQSIVSSFNLESEEANELLPDPILSAKFISHLEVPGVLYLGSDGDPVWFTVGRSEQLIPSVYTLWKRPTLIPQLLTGSGVVPILIGGADLMIPGVVRHPPGLLPDQLVSISQFSRLNSGEISVSAPVAVGRMAIQSDSINGQEKGKAVLTIHTWKDHLWGMGRDPGGSPPSQPLTESNTELSSEGEDVETRGAENSTAEPSGTEVPYRPCSPEEVSRLLHLSLVQAIASRIPNTATFPIPASSFFSNYVLPSRPAFPSALLEQKGDERLVNPSDITIKGSTHKSLTAFLKTAEKASLITLKSPQKHSNQTEVLVVSVNGSHPTAQNHITYGTIGDAELKAAKKAQREEEAKERDNLRATSVTVTELYKAHGPSIPLFEAMSESTATLYNSDEVKKLMISYSNSHNLVNRSDQAYIQPDDLLRKCSATNLTSKEAQSNSSKGLKREELVSRVLESMQSWHEVQVPGRDAVRKKGALSPIQIATKTRQGRKAVTVVSGFETFLVIKPETMAEDLRKLCAGSTAIESIPGRPANSGLEVSVQGKHGKVVADYLESKGIPRRMIEILPETKKK